MRTLGRIYSCPAPNLQGRYQIMDLLKRHFIASQKVVNITITYVVINAIEKMSGDQGFNSFTSMVEK